MSEGVDFRSVPVVDVHGGNIKQLWPALRHAISSSDFVALDLELSGLGNRRQLSAQSVADRYKHLCEVTRSRAVVALGLSCFKQLSTTADCRQWMVQTYDLNVLCSENYTVEPDSLKFLVDHGFDFNKQCAKGLPYHRGNDKDKEPDISLRSLFGHLLVSKRPVVTHNSLVDLVFLYESFYAELPPSFNVFVADLATIFSAGLFDTKYLAEFEFRTQASFLEYLFRSSQRRNFASHRSSGRCASVTFVSYPSGFSCVDQVRCGLPPSVLNPPVTPQRPTVELCEKYSGFGFCPHGVNCTRSHDLDHILDAEAFEVFRKSRKRRRRRQKGSKAADDAGDADRKSEESSDEDDADQSGEQPTSNDSAKPNPKPETSTECSSRPARAWCKGGHRAGFDAFMTGFFFAWCLQQPGRSSEPSDGPAGEVPFSDIDGFLSRLKHTANHVSLSGKDQPLLLVKSHFAKTSAQHNTKWAKLYSVDSCS